MKNLTDRCAVVLQQIDDRISAIAGNWPDESRALRCLKTAIEGLLLIERDPFHAGGQALSALTTLCDQWEAAQ
jgi:hypothetical protein